ncbi:cub and zona pellucida-like domain-containing protein 1 [Plakobranchus ocellatus]|uniref:Cub and zona pellucida-like domain-containing protein 1 n=1 Tax=Plakobranchus ocellatus TaxID=259542 RepID=A0AAV3ZDD7_9GAST|nr:cub and zona pellucida-like domain-containing protein 1 [Plakobranchus ocellatus]
MCIDPIPYREKAYNGAYTIYFPDPTKGKSREPSRCSWLIQSYRKDYVIQLQFREVSLTRNTDTGVCWEKITVYDGPKRTSNVLASFCGTSSPEIVTSSREALIVFSSTNSSRAENSMFQAKYRATVDRHANEDTSHILRIAFGSFIGAAAFMVVCGGVCRKYKQAHPERSFFQFGRPRVNSAVRGGSIDSRSSIDARITRPAGRQPERLSLRNRIIGFFQGVRIKLTPTRYIRNGGTSTSTMRSGASLSPAEQLQQAGQAVHLRDNGGQWGVHSSPNNTEFDLHVVGGDRTNTPDNLDHANFGYQNIPTSSFTSDPAAVKPPTYEESVNNLNPLYLYHHGPYNNPVFSIKDEPADPAQSFSPPPPYSEHLIDNCNNATQGNNILVQNNNAQVRGVRMAPLPHVAQAPGGVSFSVAAATAEQRPTSQEVQPTAPPDIDTPIDTTALAQSGGISGVCQSQQSIKTERDKPSDQQEAVQNHICPTEAASPNVGAISVTDSLGTVMLVPMSTSSSVMENTPPLSTLAFTSSPQATADRQQLQSSPRDTDVSVGVGGTRLREAAESRAAPLTPVYLSQEGKDLRPGRPKQTNATMMQSLNVAQATCEDTNADVVETGNTCIQQAPNSNASMIESNHGNGVLNNAVGSATSTSTASADTSPAISADTTALPLEMLRRNGLISSVRE